MKKTLHKNLSLFFFISGLYICAFPRISYISTATISPLLIILGVTIIWGYYFLNQKFRIIISTERIAVLILIGITFLMFLRTLLFAPNFNSAIWKNYIFISLAHLAFLTLTSQIFSDEKSIRLLFSSILVFGTLLSTVIISVYIYVSIKIAIFSPSKVMEFVAKLTEYRDIYVDYIPNRTILEALSSMNGYYGKVIEISIAISMVASMLTATLIFSKHKVSLIYKIMSLLNICALIILYSRGAILGFFVAIGICVVKAHHLIFKRKVFGTLIIFLLVIMLFFAFSYEFNPIVNWIEGKRQASDSMRINIWLTIIKDAFLSPLGQGFNSIMAIKQPDISVEHVHSSFLRVLHDLGFLGSLPLFFLIIFIFRRAWMLTTKELSSYHEDSVMGLSLLSGMIAFCLCCLFNDGDKFYNSLSFFILLAIINNRYLLVKNSIKDQIASQQ